MNPVLIVGGGVAGISLAHSFGKLGVDFRIIDDGNNVCSAVAAGIVNPLSFRRTLLSWNAHPFYFEALAFYQEVEALLNTQCCFPIRIRRIFGSPDEKTTWQQRLLDPDYSPFMMPLEDSDEHYLPFGSGKIHGFWIDAAAFIQLNHRHFEEQGKLWKASFSEQEFSVENMTYQGIRFSKVIFALGYRNKALSWFQKVPIQSTQGEVLTVTWQNPDTTTSIHRKVYALPLGNHQYKLGATYKWNTESLEPSLAARKELLEKFHGISTDEVQVVKHEVGIRPTSPDRRPFIGEHATHKGLFVFNGLGTKGYLTAPSLAHRFVHQLKESKPQDPATHLYRFTRS